jgi:hypothetical protein
MMSLLIELGGSFLSPSPEKSLGDPLDGGSTSYVQKVGRITSVVLDDVHGGS